MLLPVDQLNSITQFDLSEIKSKIVEPKHRLLHAVTQDLNSRTFYIINHYHESHRLVVIFDRRRNMHWHGIFYPARTH
jgi:hypothetical protein